MKFTGSAASIWRSRGRPTVWSSRCAIPGRRPTRSTASSRSSSSPRRLASRRLAHSWAATSLPSPSRDAATASPPDPVGRAPPRPRGPTTTAGRRRRRPLVIICDDVEDIRQLFAVVLAAAGARVVTASSGREAVALAAISRTSSARLDLGGSKRRRRISWGGGLHRPPSPSRAAARIDPRRCVPGASPMRHASPCRPPCSWTSSHGRCAAGSRGGPTPATDASAHVDEFDFEDERGVRRNDGG
jgi:hypothetical protein